MNEFRPRPIAQILQPKVELSPAAQISLLLTKVRQFRVARKERLPALLTDFRNELVELRVIPAFKVTVWRMKESSGVSYWVRISRLDAPTTLPLGDKEYTYDLYQSDYLNRAEYTAREMAAFLRVPYKPYQKPEDDNEPDTMDPDLHDGLLPERRPTLGRDPDSRNTAQEG